MTAIHGFYIPEGVAILADGALCDADGMIDAAVDKIYVADSGAFAFAASTADFLRDRRIFDDMAKAKTLEALLGRLSDEIDIYRAVAEHDGRKIYENNSLHILIAGISRDGNPELHCAVVGPYELPAGVKPWAVTKIDIQDWGTGSVVPLDKLQALLAGVHEFSREVLIQRGADFFELQRRIPIRSPGNAEPHYGIGCHVDLAIVSRTGVERHRLRTWPDRIGERINPLTGR